MHLTLNFLFKKPHSCNRSVIITDKKKVTKLFEGIYMTELVQATMLALKKNPTLELVFSDRVMGYSQLGRSEYG
jgi:hypothetical protein